MADVLARIETFYVGDDWVYPYAFVDSRGTAVDKSTSTFSAYLITESPYTVTTITGANGTVDISNISNGGVTVTVSDALTSTLTPDMDSVDVPNNGATGFNTRLVLSETIGTITTTACITPIRVLRR